MRIITEDEVAAVLDLPTVTDRLEQAFGDLGRRTAASTLRVRAAVDGAMSSALAAAWPEGGVTGGKVYATKDGVFTFVVVVFDLEGRVLGVMEGDHLTRLRTAAGTAVAIRHLSPAAPAVATVIGTGRQCVGHLDVIAQELPDVGEVRVVGRRPAAIEAAVEHARRLGLPAHGLADPAAAVRDAGLVITLTSASQPLFGAGDLADGALVCALGATKADRCEIGPDVAARAHAVVVDSLDGSRIECGDLIQAAAAGTFAWDRAVELADVVADAGQLPAVDGPGIVLLESQGIALQDVVAGALVVERLPGRERDQRP